MSLGVFELTVAKACDFRLITSNYFLSLHINEPLRVSSVLP